MESQDWQAVHGTRDDDKEEKKEEEGERAIEWAPNYMYAIASFFIYCF